MNTIGKVCLGLTLVCMLVSVYLGARLGKHANSWAVKVRDAKVGSEKAVAEQAKAAQELSTARAELARIKMGWGFEWTIPPGGAAGGIQVAGGRLAVSGLGSSNGLATRQVDVNGQPQMIAPNVHVFALNGEAGSVYIGEFMADPQQLGPNNAALIPTWNVTPQEVASWNFSQGVRLRSQVPPAERASFESVNQSLQRTRELYSETQTAIDDQQTLLAEAQKQLANRKAELLGNPAIPLIADRPEFTIGLVSALENLEEDRNASQLAVDHLRRAIKAAADVRTAIIATLNELAAQLPEPQSRVSQLQN